MDVKEYHDTFYSPKCLELSEKGNNFSKIANLWLDRKKHMAVLDIGCGAGAVSEDLVKKGHEVYGLDAQEQAIKKAIKRGLKAEVFDLNNKLPFGDKKFDAVLALDVLEHLFAPLTLLNEITRVLKDEGFLIALLPLHFDIRQRLRILLGKGIVSYEHLTYCKDYTPWNYAHLRFFTLEEAKELIKSANFKTDKIDYRPLAPAFWGVKTPINITDIENEQFSVFSQVIKYGRTFSCFMAKSLPSLFASGISLRLTKAQI